MSELFYISDIETDSVSMDSTSTPRQTKLSEYFPPKPTISPPSPQPSLFQVYPSYPFFEDTTLYFSYFLSLRTLPTEDKILYQFGFTQCCNAYEQKQLLRVYFHVLFAGYAQEIPFLYKRLQGLYHALLQDTLADYIMVGYGLYPSYDEDFYWFVRRSEVVKHHRSYDVAIQDKESHRRFYQRQQKVAHFSNTV